MLDWLTQDHKATSTIEGNVVCAHNTEELLVGDIAGTLPRIVLPHSHAVTRLGLSSTLRWYQVLEEMMGRSSPSNTIPSMHKLTTLKPKESDWYARLVIFELLILKCFYIPCQECEQARTETPEHEWYVHTMLSP